LAHGGDGNTGGGNSFSNGGASGGAIANVNFQIVFTLVVSNCSFTDNRAVSGTGNMGGILVGTSIGGALANFDTPFPVGGAVTAVISSTTFTGNRAIGGQGGANNNGRDGLGGALANFWGATLTASGCTISGNQATGGAGLAGGNAFGGGIFNDGPSALAVNLGLPATLTLTGSAITNNQATGGPAGGPGIGGGIY